MLPTSFRDLVRYRFDQAMSRGPSALVGWLLAVSALVVVLLGLLVVLVRLAPVQDGQRPVPSASLWTSLLHFLDNGNISSDATSAGWGYIAVMLLLTLAGIVFGGAVTGIITNGLASRLDLLRRGHSTVIERGHVVVLGWSPQIFAVLGELIEAGRNQPSTCLVVLAQMDKVEMELALRARLPHARRLRIVCRTGSPLDRSDLNRVSPQSARAVVVLSPDADDPDAQVIKTVLALVNAPDRDARTHYRIVAEIRSEHNLEAAQLVGGGEATYLRSGELMSKITVQTCLQSGLSTVYSELLSFAGSELYFAPLRGLAGQPFAAALLAFEQETVIGLRGPGGGVRLNPAGETPIGAQDQLIVIAQDDAFAASTVQPPRPDPQLIVAAPQFADVPERTLILGWNPQAQLILSELATYLPPGSEVTVAAPLSSEQLGQLQARNLWSGQRSRLEFRAADPTSRAALLALDPGSYRHLLVLADSDLIDPQQADARTLITLLHLRQLFAGADSAGGARPPTIVSEMLDSRNRDLAEVTQADDFIVSDRLTSALLAQLAETPGLSAVFDVLFDHAGPELYLKAAQEYVTLGAELTFATVVEAARQRGEIAVGDRLAAQAREAGHNYGVRLNPAKSQLRRYGPGDQIVVLAEGRG